MAPSPGSFCRLSGCELPIFRQDHSKDALFYAPGYLAVIDRRLLPSFTRHLQLGITERWPIVASLRHYATEAQRLLQETLTTPFRPVCLTLYLNNECNLGRTYCYSNPTPRPAPRLSLPAIQAGVELVAQNCHARGRFLTAVFHGGGEPTLNHEALATALNEVEQVVAAYNLSLFRYIATNGVMPQARAAWVASRFDLIGLSCDGPNDIQNQQRPLWGNGQTAVFVERMAQVVHKAGKPLHVRVTVTPQTVARQSEIAHYLCQVLRPQEIHVEPVYQGGRAQQTDCSPIDQADAFVEGFLEARQVANNYGVSWLCSGSRPGEVHGPYCHIFRDVLNLVPGGVAVACFKTTTADRSQKLSLGDIHAVSFQSSASDNRIQALRRSLWDFPPQCDDCFNQYHCARDCPDHCPLDGPKPASEFRCQVQKRLVKSLLQETAVTLRATAAAAGGIAGAEVRFS
jgi:sulfatase maturation enzyme AslB (radical SAM superfamily)